MASIPLPRTTIQRQAHSARHRDHARDRGDGGRRRDRAVKGGMKTKITAGKIALAAGTDMVITTGKIYHPLRAISEGARVTWFIAKSDPVTAKKRWISGQLVPNGQIFLDAGAAKALLTAKASCRPA